MSSHKRVAKGIDDAVKYFTTATSKLKFKGNDELLWALDCIEATSARSGLHPDHIVALIDVAASGIQVETLCKRIIKSLIPQSVVPDRAVVKCISWLCTRKPSINIQCLLLRWILVIYDYMDTRENLHALYGVLFHFLHYRILMPYVCHLLYLLTRKEDVRLFRVRFLIQYQKDMGPQAFLTGLLSIYRHYYPNLVHTAYTRSYKSFFPTYDRKWSATIRLVRERNGLPPTVDVSWDQALLERLHPEGQKIDLVPSRKRRKIDPIPVINSLTTKSDYRRDTLAHSLGMNSVPFILIHSFKDVLDNLETIEILVIIALQKCRNPIALQVDLKYTYEKCMTNLVSKSMKLEYEKNKTTGEFPSQIGAVLRSDALKHVMSYTKDHLAEGRFQYWVSETLREELVDCLKQRNVERVTTLLKLINLFSDFLQEGIPSVDMIIFEYLNTWNGVHYTSEIFKLLSRCRIYPFTMLRQFVLEPLKKLFFSSSVYFKCKVLICLTEMLRNQAANEWPRSREEADSSCLCLFSNSREGCSSPDSIIKLVKYVSKMILVACIAERQYPLFELIVLDFLRLASNLHKAYGLPFVVLVEPRLLELLFISPHPMTVSGVCEIICRYKENFTLLKALQKSGEQVYNHEEVKMIRSFNQLIIDFSNNLWRLKAFSSKNEKSLFHWQREEADKENVGSDPPGCESLGLFRHPALLPFTIRYVQKVLKKPTVDFAELQYLKRDFLNYLDHHYLTGVSDFIAACIRSKSLLSATTQPSQVMGISQTLNTPSKHDNSAFGF